MIDYVSVQVVVFVCVDLYCLYIGFVNMVGVVSSLLIIFDYFYGIVGFDVINGFCE